LDLADCKNLTKIPSGIDKLKSVNLYGCTKLDMVPRFEFASPSTLRYSLRISSGIPLESFGFKISKLFQLKGLTDCASLIENHEAITYVDDLATHYSDFENCGSLSATNLGMMPMTNLRRLREITKAMTNLRMLPEITKAISMLRNLGRLRQEIKAMTNLSWWPEIFEDMTYLCMLWERIERIKAMTNQERIEAMKNQEIIEAMTNLRIMPRTNLDMMLEITEDCDLQDCSRFTSLSLLHLRKMQNSKLIYQCASLVENHQSHKDNTYVEIHKIHKAITYVDDLVTLYLDLKNCDYLSAINQAIIPELVELEDTDVNAGWFNLDAFLTYHDDLASYDQDHEIFKYLSHQNLEMMSEISKLIDTRASLVEIHEAITHLVTLMRVQFFPSPKLCHREIRKLSQLGILERCLQLLQDSELCFCRHKFRTDKSHGHEIV
jgi:superfamily I DNA/RNA helicase